MSRWVSLNQARAKASLNASWSVRNRSLIARNSGSRFSAMSAVVIIVGTLMFGSQAAGAMSSSLLVDRLPLVGARGRLHQLVIVVEQQAEIILGPLRGRVGPRALDAAGDGVLADAAALVAADPAEALRDEIAARRRVAEQRRVAVAVRLAEGVAAGGQRDGFLVRSSPCARRFPSCRAPCRRRRADCRRGPSGLT